MHGTKKTIVYITPLTFNKRDFARYGIAFMLNQNIDVHIIDVAEFVIPSAPKHRDEYENWKTVKFHLVHNSKELESIQNILKSANLIINLIPAIGHGPSQRNLHVLQEISRSKSKTLINYSNVIPGYRGPRTNDGSTWFHLKNLPERLRRTNFKDSLISRLPLRLLGLREADYAVYGGEKSQITDPFIGQSTQHIFAHNVDYDHYLEISKKPPALEDTAVFIDQGLASHREYIGSKMHNDFDGERYRKSLIALFDKVEADTGLSVIVAPHPHLAKSYKRDAFGNRLIINDQTAQIISKCKLVIAHTSMAIGLAVMFKKPILLIFSREHMNRFPESVLFHKGIAESLNKKSVFLDEIDDLDIASLIKIDDDAYDQYFRNYIKSPNSIDKPFWEIILDSTLRTPVLHA